LEVSYLGMYALVSCYHKCPRVNNSLCRSGEASFKICLSYPPLWKHR